MGRFVLLGTAAAALVFAGSLFAQGLSTMNGTVTDSSAAVIAGARVTVVEVDRSHRRHAEVVASGVLDKTPRTRRRMSVPLALAGSRCRSSGRRLINQTETSTVHTSSTGLATCLRQLGRPGIGLLLRAVFTMGRWTRSLQGRLPSRARKGFQIGGRIVIDILFAIATVIRDGVSGKVSGISPTTNTSRAGPCCSYQCCQSSRLAG